MMNNNSNINDQLAPCPYCGGKVTGTGGHTMITKRTLGIALFGVLTILALPIILLVAVWMAYNEYDGEDEP